MDQFDKITSDDSIQFDYDSGLDDVIAQYFDGVNEDSK
jgi:hypothetical protein